jgi:hypothetical protein
MDRGSTGIGLVVRPANLLSAIELQFYKVVAGVTDLTTCEHCGEWFERGQAGTRRAGARFCSDDCRSLHNNQRRGKGDLP